MSAVSMVEIVEELAVRARKELARRELNGRADVEETEEKAELSGKQLQVLELLLLGESQRVSAERVGVAEETVSRWVNHDDGFQTELQRRRQDTWDSQRDRLLTLSNKAIDVLEEIVTAPESENAALRASLAILKALGLDEGGRAEDAEAIRKMKESAAAMDSIMDIRF